MPPQCEAYMLHLTASSWLLPCWSVQGDVSCVLIYLQWGHVGDSCSGLGEEHVGCAGCHLSGLVGDSSPGCWGKSGLGLLVIYSSCVHGESALTSAGASASDPISLSSLVRGKGMDRKLRVLTWGLPYRQLKTVL